MNMLYILLAEDNEADVFLVQHALAKHSIPHQLYVVRNGPEVANYFHRMGTPDGIPCPSLLLLDLNLPAIDGLQILNELRKRSDCDMVPVIVMSSSASPTDLVRAEQMGVSHYFRKPLDLEDFLQLGAVVKAVAEQASA